ncbi:hypothetical protein BN1708_013802 [Verticillium longisporum]|uniref:Zn(2)-C6 fungal-type domain-containing protein n=2 Tax=Verticillium longisporum TaxID=100787 RepID=A0A0G4LP31_VERLO|nr:hypothetical protein BN1708_013802 [Verticillium longisporum]
MPLEEMSPPHLPRDSTDANLPSRPPDLNRSDADSTRPDAPAPAQLRRVQRSCEICHRRKIRCDKQQPCSHCKRGGVTCLYPHAEHLRRARKPKTTMADVATRISELERTLVSVSNQAATAETVTSRSQPCDTFGPEGPHSVASSGHNGGPGVLVHKGLSSQYFNEILISRVLDEEQDIQTVLSTPVSEATRPVSVPQFNPMGIFSVPSYSRPLSSFLPNKTVATQLWKAYVDKVEPCTKVLHLPTAEVLVYTVIDKPGECSPGMLALSFAIFFAAATVYDQDEAVGVLGNDPVASLQLLKTGLEQAIAHADFLESPTVTTIQALAIYLSIGLHRDGKMLGLSPFESEIRRRLWWYIVCRDGRAAEDYGLENMRRMTPGSAAGIDMPLNVHDSDLYPEMEELPLNRPGWTAMTLPLIGIATVLGWHENAQSTPTPGDGTRSQVIQDIRARTKGYLSRCNPVIPQQRLTMHIADFVLRKLELVTRQRMQMHAQPGTHEAFATEENLLEAVEILELGTTLMTDDRLRPWQWSTRLYPQNHMLLYVLWHLCVCPDGPNRDRIWQVVETVFSDTEATRAGSVGAGDLGSRWAVLTVLKEKAFTKRAGETAASGASRVQDQTQVATPGVMDAVGVFTQMGNFDWVEDLQVLPDWTTLMKDFQMENAFKFGV